MCPYMGNSRSTGNVCSGVWARTLVGNTKMPFDSYEVDMHVSTPYGDGKIVDFMKDGIIDRRVYAVVLLEKDAPKTKDLGGNRVLLNASQVNLI